MAFLRFHPIRRWCRKLALSTFVVFIFLLTHQAAFSQDLFSEEAASGAEVSAAAKASVLAEIDRQTQAGVT
ncbi:MAG: hypothetical protein ACREAE_04915, partial [Nitrosopumilaceae archaeon]